MDFPQLDELTLESQEARTVEDTKPTSIRMAFIGAGQGGCKIADEFWAQGYRRVLMVNTTELDMAGLECPHRLIIGGGVGGAGKNPEVGKKAAQASREEVLRACKKAFGNNVELVVVCTGAGGGTGSGSTPVLIDMARDYLASIGAPVHVGVIAAFPKKSEGASVTNNAQSLMAHLLDEAAAKRIAPLVVVDNEKIGRMFPKASITEFFKTANKNIAGLFNVFNELTAQASPYSSMDSADYRSILFGGGVVFGMMPITNTDEETAIAAAVEKNVKGGLLSDSISIVGATHAGAILVASKAKLATIPQSNLDMAFETLQRVMGGKNVVLHSGVYDGPDGLGEKAMLYTIASCPVG